MHECYFGNSAYLCLFKAFWNFSIFLFKLQDLLVRHFFYIWFHMNALLWFFNSLLKHSFFFSFSTMCTSHWAHQNLHHHFSFSPFGFLLLQLHGHMYLSDSIIHICITSTTFFLTMSSPATRSVFLSTSTFFFFSLFVFNFGNFWSDFKVLLS